MPAVEYRRRQRAISPSEQSSSIWSWISATAPAAGTTPGRLTRNAAARPATSVAQVTAVALIRVGRIARVTYGESRRM